MSIMNIIRKFGKYSIVNNQGNICITDGWLTDYIVFRDGKWLYCDTPYLGLRKDVNEYLNKMASK